MTFDVQARGTVVCWAALIAAKAGSVVVIVAPAARPATARTAAMKAMKMAEKLKMLEQ